MTGGKGIDICIPKYVCTSGGSLYGLVARKLKRWNEPFRACINVDIESVPRIGLLTDSVDRSCFGY